MTIAEQRIISTVFLIVCCLLLGVVAAQPQATGFKDTDALLHQASELKANILAPKSFAAAEKYYQSARKSTESGNPKTAQKYLVKANASLRAAIESAKVAEITFTDTLNARERAVTAQAEMYEPALWSKGETELVRAATKLESGNSNGGRVDAITAGKSYTVAELAAIKTGIVGNARILIAEAEADPNKVERNAPITLAQAKSLVAQAEAAVDVNRYQTDEPKALAAEAEYQARHAMYLASQVAMLGARQLTGEELILRWEKPLQDIAGALNVTTDMSAGYSAASEAALTRAKSLTAQNVEKNARINTLEVELGDTELVIRETEESRQKMARVEASFRPDEARVLREGDDLILRLIGLSFPTGESVIETEYFGLLSAVQKSIATFPDSYIVVAGHTDSQGDAEENLILSQERANSVRAYLIASSGVPATQISAEGYGESRPVASNMYAVGRAQNRRIDIVLRNVGDSSQQTARTGP